MVLDRLRLRGLAQSSPTGADFSSRFTGSGATSHELRALREELRALIASTDDDEAEFYRHFIAPDIKPERLERVHGTGTTEPATRAEAFALSNALHDSGHPCLASVPLICFEWLQRPENVLTGAISWTDYRPANRPGHVRIEHHKTRKMIWQPLDDPDVTDGDSRFFPELEDFLTGLPHLGVPIVLLEPKRGPKSEETGRRTPRLYSLEHARHLVQEARKAAKLPDHVTFAACRHGGKTELGDAERPSSR